MKVLMVAVLFFANFCLCPSLRLAAATLDSEQFQKDPREEVVGWLDEVIVGMGGSPYLNAVKEFRRGVNPEKIRLLPANASLSSHYYFFDKEGNPHLGELHINYELFGLLMEKGRNDARYRMILENTLVFHGAWLKFFQNNDLSRKREKKIEEYSALTARQGRGEGIDQKQLVRLSQEIVAFAIHSNYLASKEQLLDLQRRSLDAEALRQLMAQETNPVLRVFLSGMSTTIEGITKRGEIDERELKRALFNANTSVLEQQFPGIIQLASGRTGSLDFLWDEETYNLGTHPLMRFFEGLAERWLALFAPLLPYANLIYALTVIFALPWLGSLAWQSRRIRGKIIQGAKIGQRTFWFLGKPARYVRFRQLKWQIKKRGLELFEKSAFSLTELALILRILRADEKGEEELTKIIRETKPIIQRERGFWRRKVECFLEKKGVQLTFFDGFFVLPSIREQIQAIVAALNNYLERQKREAERRVVLAQRVAEEVKLPPSPTPRAPTLPRAPRRRRVEPEVILTSAAEPARESFKDFLDRMLKENRITRQQYDYFIDEKGGARGQAVEDFLSVTGLFGRISFSSGFLTHSGYPIERLTSSAVPQRRVEEMISLGLLTWARGHRNNVLITGAGSRIRRWLDENRENAY